MADEVLMRLKENSNIVDFAPAAGYEEPEDLREAIQTSMSGIRYTHTWSKKERWEVPLTYLPIADKAKIKTWWDDKTIVEFYPDYLNSPGTSVNVRIINSQNPLVMAYPFWNQDYEGVLILREV